MARRLPVRGRERLARRLYVRHPREPGFWNVRLRPDRLLVRLPCGAAQSWSVAFTGGYDEGQVSLLSSYLVSGAVALDVGASLGLYTVQLAARAKRVGARVVAVEPVPANAEIIRRNLDANGLAGSASVIEKAVGANAGSVTIRTELGGVGNGAVIDSVASSDLLTHSVAGNLGADVTVPVTTLDALELDSPVCIVKMDVEGFEMEVLAGAKQFIASNRPPILAEFNVPWMAARGWAEESPFRWAEDNAYTVMKVVVRRSGLLLKRAEARIEPITSPSGRQDADLLLIP